MQIQIPKELMQYVRMSKKDGLVHHPAMPKELQPLFEKTKTAVLQTRNEREEELRNLLVKEEE